MVQYNKALKKFDFIDYTVDPGHTFLARVISSFVIFKTKQMAPQTRSFLLIDLFFVLL